MKRTIMLWSIVFMFIGGWVVMASNYTIDTIYSHIKKMSEHYTPSYYRVKIENKKFEDALKDLPEDVLIGGKTPYVTIIFQKGIGVKIVIANIKKEYSSLFSMYEDYFKFSGISKVQNPLEFKTIIDKGKVKFYKEEGDYVIVQAWDPEKKEKGNDYAFFYLDKKRWVIRKAVYYLDGVPYVESLNSYKMYGKYFLPYKIEMKSLTENTEDIFYFKDYQFEK